MTNPTVFVLIVLFLIPVVIHAQPVTDHPRLWLQTSDLDRLRSWAVASNPVYQDGLLQVALAARNDMDNGLVPDLDEGGNTWDQYPCEMYAELFAFMSLVDPDPVARADWVQRARTLLMWVMDRAVLGAAPATVRSPERWPERTTWRCSATPPACTTPPSRTSATSCTSAGRRCGSNRMWWCSTTVRTPPPPVASSVCGSTCRQRPR